jgi:hypothetical protein
MSRSVFGWSLPPGCGRLPGEEPEPVQPRCSHCNGFLPWKPDRTENWESWTKVPVEYARKHDGMKYGECKCHRLTDDPNVVEEIEWAGTTLIWTCKRCGKEVRVSEG